MRFLTPPLATLRRQQLQTNRRPRDSTPRCPDCKSFLHECTCEGTVGSAAALAATDALASNRLSQDIARRASPPPFEKPHSLKRPRSTLGEEAEIRLKEPPSRRGDGGGSTTWSKSVGAPDKVTTIDDSRHRVRKEGGGDDKEKGKGEGEEKEGVQDQKEGEGEDEKEEEEEEGGGDDMDVEHGSLCAHDGGVLQSVLTESADGGSRADQLLKDKALGASKDLEEHKDGKSARGEEHSTSNSARADRRDTDRQARSDSRPVSANVVPAASAIGLGKAGRDNKVKLAGHVENDMLSDMGRSRLALKEDEAERWGRVGEEKRPSGEAEVVRLEGFGTHVDPLREEDGTSADADGGVSRERTGGNSDGDALRGDNANGKASPGRGSLGDADGDIGENRSRGGPGNGSQPVSEWLPRKGDLVEVKRRMSPGVNKLGGTARVVKVDSAAGTVDVRYMVEGGWERGIDTVYVSPAVLDLNEKRSTLGRCRHCGSLRVDCRQGCAFYTTPQSPRLLPRPSSFHVPVLADRSQGAATHGSESGRDSRRRKERRRGSGRHRHGSHAPDGARIDQNRHESKRQRRRLPDQWDEEGEPVPGDGEVGDKGDDSRRSPVEGGRESNSVFPLSMRGTSGGNSTSSDGDVIGARYRNCVSNKQRVLRWSESQSESGSDSDVELLGDREAVGFSNDGDGSGGSSGGSDDASTNDGEGDLGEEGGSLSGGSLGSRVWLRDAAGAVNNGAALFLVPEGEEAARMLPLDIQDPTRGITDPDELQEEFNLRLQKIAGSDTDKLERDVAEACR